jgi:hypothetical protein
LKKRIRSEGKKRKTKKGNGRRRKMDGLKRNREIEETERKIRRREER